jgi:hypothetical protein
MESTHLSKKVSRLYLLLVPIIVIIIGFGLGRISYLYYLPIWFVNVCLMLLASWVVGLRVIKTKQSYLAVGAFFLIVPIILVSWFFGLGPPPDTAKEWVATATEQQVRYFTLTVAGIFIVLGFTFLKVKLRTVENYYSLLGIALIYIAIPLFILDMLFWGFTLTETFKIVVSTNADSLPPWLSPLSKLFGMVSVVEVALTYLATIFFAVALKRAGFLSNTSSIIYVLLSLVAFMFIVLSAFLPEPFITAGFAVSIPAIPFIMPYYMGVSLLEKAGLNKFHDN